MNDNPLSSRLKAALQVLIDAGRFPYSDVQLQGQPVNSRRWKLFLTSFCLLFFELACIRWTPAYVRFLGYFLNFILLASFLGIGAGVLAGRKARLWIPPFPVLWFVLCISVVLNRVEIRLPNTQVLYYGAGEGVVQAENLLVLPVIFVLVALCFIPLARMLGRYIASLPPLQAYAFDILGSLAGIATFFLMSYFSLPPVVWFGILTVALIPLLGRKEWALSLPFVIGALWLVAYLGRVDYWSPYYRIQVTPNDRGGYMINVNQVGHQETMPAEQKETFYFRVYDLYPDRPFEKVLVIGAGTGSDVAIALQNGAQQVDAVEIDPLIYRLGQQLNPDRPYDDLRVHVYVDDGRAFLRNTNERYDLIVFALPDSLTLTSAFSSLRLESFLLTEEAVGAARERLDDDGLLVLYNYYRQDWLVRKLAGMVETAFGTPPFVTTYGDWGRAAVLIAGPRLAQMNPAFLAPYVEPSPHPAVGRGWALPVIGQGLLSGDPALAIARDDWPFIYMPVRTLPSIYLLGLGTVLLIALALTGLAAPPATLRRFNWHFFWLGAAFMLLETRSLVTFSLLFGSTWMVNSLVFFAILSSVLLAILFNARYRVRNVRLLYALLFISLALNYIIPQGWLLGIQIPALRYGLASLLAFLPIFLANVVFSHSFRDTDEADVAFGSNLLGSMTGGLCEYLALVLGYRSLLLAAILFYALAMFLRRPDRVGLATEVAAIELRQR